MYAVIVEVKVKPGLMTRFMPMIRANAKNSLALEPGCHQFDICVAESDPELILLYEVYDTPEAFKAHMRTRHFQTFDDQVADMMASKRVLTARRLPAET